MGSHPSAGNLPPIQGGCSSLQPRAASVWHQAFIQGEDVVRKDHAPGMGQMHDRVAEIDETGNDLPIQTFPTASSYFPGKLPRQDRHTPCTSSTPSLSRCIVY